MKLDYKLEPLIQVKPREDNILFYGCYQITLNFMMKPVGVVTKEQLADIATRMMKAACDVIKEEYDKPEEGGAPSHISSDTQNPENTKSSEETPAPSSPTLIV